MPYDRLTLSGDPASLARELRELIPAPESVRDQVTEIIARVRASGDDALRFYTREFDTGGTTPSALRVPDAELDTALARLDDSVRGGLQQAIHNVSCVAEASMLPDRTVAFDGHDVTIREVPVDRAAVYVPGGRAPYPSTVVMGVVTARVAGVREIAVCAPPGADGEVNWAVLGACRRGTFEGAGAPLSPWRHGAGTRGVDGACQVRTPTRRLQPRRRHRGRAEPPHADLTGDRRPDLRVLDLPEP